MARTAVPVTAVPGPYVTTTPPLVTWTAAFVADGNMFAANGRRVLLARNVGASPHTVTIETLPVSPTGWEQDHGPHSIAAGAMRSFQMFPSEGFRQNDGNVWFGADHVEIEFAVLDIPNA